MPRDYNDRKEQLEEASLLRVHISYVLLYHCDGHRARRELCQQLYQFCGAKIRSLVSAVVTPVSALPDGTRANVWPYFRLSRRRYRVSGRSLPVNITSSGPSQPGLELVLRETGRPV